MQPEMMYGAILLGAILLASVLYLSPEYVAAIPRLFQSSDDLQKEKWRDRVLHFMVAVNGKGTFARVFNLYLSWRGCRPTGGAPTCAKGSVRQGPACLWETVMHRDSPTNLFGFW